MTSIVGSIGYELVDESTSDVTKMVVSSDTMTITVSDASFVELLDPSVNLYSAKAGYTRLGLYLIGGVFLGGLFRT